MKTNKGYTLIELLIVIGLFGFISIFLISILSTTLRISQQINTLSTIRQNGNYAMEAISRDISNENHFESLSTDGSNYQACDSHYTPDTSTKYIKYFDTNNQEVVIGCPSSPNPRPAFTNIIKTPTSNPTNIYSYLDSQKVALIQCYFECIQPSGASYPSAIKVHFTLQQPNSNALPENSETASFDNTIYINNNSYIPTPTPTTGP